MADDAVLRSPVICGWGTRRRRCAAVWNKEEATEVTGFTSDVGVNLTRVPPV